MRAFPHTDMSFSWKLSKLLFCYPSLWWLGLKMPELSHALRTLTIRSNTPIGMLSTGCSSSCLFYLLGPFLRFFSSWQSTNSPRLRIPSLLKIFKFPYEPMVPLEKMASFYDWEEIDQNMGWLGYPIHRGIIKGMICIT